jgi:pimeloyl-ACP methyl ester carboxylesterase
MKLEIIAHKAEGEAKPTPIMFAHGAWHGAWCWQDNFLPYFTSKGYDVYAVSYRDHGGSEKTGKLRWAGINHYVDDLAQAVGELDKTPILVGHSMGGLVVQKYLEKNQVPAAVLLAPVPTGGVLMTTFRIASRHPLIFAKSLATMRLYPIVSTPALVREDFFSEDVAPDDLSRYCSLMQDESFRGFLDMLVFCLPKPKKVKSPIMVLGAERDTIFSCKQMEKTAAAYGAKLTMYPMAHDMMLEVGWQDVADEIVNWLTEQNL